MENLIFCAVKVCHWLNFYVKYTAKSERYFSWSQSFGKKERLSELWKKNQEILFALISTKMFDRKLFQIK